MQNPFPGILGPSEGCICHCWYRLSLAEYIAECSQAFDIDDHIEVQPGRRGLPTVYMSHPSGYSTEINLWGATVTSLLRPDGQDVLCLTPGNTFDGIHPIRQALCDGWSLLQQTPGYGGSRSWMCTL